MSHREFPRSGRGCASAVVVVPLLAVGGLAALVLTVGHTGAPPPSGSGQVQATGRQALVSVRTSVPPVPVPEVGRPAEPVEPDRPERTSQRREAEPGRVPPQARAAAPDGTPLRTPEPRSSTSTAQVVPPTRLTPRPQPTTTVDTTAPPAATTTPVEPTQPTLEPTLEPTTAPTTPGTGPPTTEPTPTEVPGHGQEHEVR